MTCIARFELYVQLIFLSPHFASHSVKFHPTSTVPQLSLSLSLFSLFASFLEEIKVSKLIFYHCVLLSEIATIIKYIKSSQGRVPMTSIMKTKPIRSHNRGPLTKPSGSMKAESPHCQTKSATSGLQGHFSAVFGQPSSDASAEDLSSLNRLQEIASTEHIGEVLFTTVTMYNSPISNAYTFTESQETLNGASAIKSWYTSNPTVTESRVSR